MRFWLVVAVTGSLVGMAGPALAGCNLSAPDAAHAGGDPCVRPWLDANMHINQLQFVGTAESYKLAPSDAMLSLIRMGGRKDAEALDFARAAASPSSWMPGRGRWNSMSPMIPRAGCSKIPPAPRWPANCSIPAYVDAMSKPGFKVIHVLDVDFHSSCVTLQGLPDRSRGLEPRAQEPSSHPDRAACQ